ncbi:TonB-dependent receptor [Tenacibaculum haliotis]|uniref:TonB-dependent receptor n=1 Tax=Tenacibaculum haliotis TaxID=1888914 RepID=UPI0021B052EA|nr:TonB-dependent receptor [Tenacibaculum haliotis]MCT4698105.1 TonB-dependent receptor [Tenacibaculum haliotis]
MKKFLLLFTLLTTLLTFAQKKAGIKGRILDENNMPLTGATIIVNSGNHGNYADFNGYYEILNLTKGTYNLQVSFIGYQTLNKTITITNTIHLENFFLKPKTNNLEEVIIKGSITRGQAKALNQQKNKDNITNIIAADQIGKFPDANIGDALKRIPGITMQNDQGEARDIIIRGLAPQLNSVTLNGDKIPSAEGDNRRVQMDLIPTEMIQLIEVNKAVTADMEGDAIGGSVNLVTRSAPANFRAYLTGSYGQNPVRSTPNYNFSALVANRIANKKLGYVINTTYNSNEYGSDNVEFEWKSPTEIKEHDIRRYDVKRNRMSVAANLDYAVNPNTTLYLKSIYTKRNDYENRYRLRYKNKGDEYKISRQTKGGINNSENDNTRLEKQSVYKFSLGGEHIIFGNVKLNWKTGLSKAKEERPNERYITYEAKQKNSDIDISQEGLNTRFPYFTSASGFDNNPDEFEIDEVSEENKYTEEKKYSSNIDIKIPFNNSSDYKNSLKFGAKNKYKEKLRDNIFYEFDTDDFSSYQTLSSTPNADYTLKGFLPGNQYKSGIFASREFLGNLNLKNGEIVLEEFVPENYNANENIFAAYALWKQRLGNKLRLSAGLRVEKTNTEYTGYAIDVETASTINDVTSITQTKNYTNWLPNLQVKYNFTDNTIARIAWTNSIARPNYFDLVPYRNLNSDDQEAEFGNPDLKPTESMNFDLMFEHYFANVGIISIGGFYKDLDNFIYKITKNEDLKIGGVINNYQVTRPLNGGTAEIYGFETSLQRKLNFLPGFLRNITVYGNYTYTNSKTTGIQEREDGLALAGAVKNMINGSLAYETNKLTLRASLNYAGDYIDEYGGESSKDRFYDTQLFVDVNASYAITKNLRIFAEAKNLTNQELRFYQGTKNQTMQSEFYNFNWNAGIKYNF